MELDDKNRLDNDNKEYVCRNYYTKLRTITCH